MSGILLGVGDIKTNKPKTLPSNSSHCLRETGYTVKQRAGAITETYAKVGGKKRKLLTLLSGGTVGEERGTGQRTCDLNDLWVE